MADRLEFVLFDPASAGEAWAQEYSANGCKVNGVKIIINGEDLLSIVAGIEKKCPFPEREYGHATVAGLYYELSNEEEGYFLPLCCLSCGETGCCTFEGQWRQDGDWIRWEHFSSKGMDDYGLNFCFAKADYTAELKKLEGVKSFSRE